MTGDSPAGTSTPRPDPSGAHTAGLETRSAHQNRSSGAGALADAGLAGVVLAAGLGTRLRPLTDLRPKALCPVGNVPLVDWAVERLWQMTPDVAVNVHHHRDQMVAHLDGRVHLSIEEPEPLGTAGALGALRDWVAGRPVMVANADSWHRGDTCRLMEGWDGVGIRLLVTHDPARGDFGPWRFAGTSLVPWAEVARLRPEPTGLYEVCWRRAEDEGRLELVALDGPFFACDTPADYLAANLEASGGESVIGAGARVLGEVERSVVWPGAVVAAGERLVEVIRADGLTVPAGAPPAAPPGLGPRRGGAGAPGGKQAT